MYICHWAEAELSQKKTVKSRSQTLKTIKEITKKQAVPLSTHLSVTIGEIFIIYKVNNAFNSSHL